MHASEELVMFFFVSSRRRHTRFDCDWSSDVCSSDLRKKDCHMLYQQSSAEAIHDGTKHLVQIRLRIQFAAELNESFSVVVAGAIKELIDTFLNPFANRVEQQRSHHDRQDHARRTRTGHASMDQL